MDKSMIRCTSCWESTSRETEYCPRCGTRLKHTDTAPRKKLGFAFWRNIILLVISVLLLISAFIPMFRMEVSADMVEGFIANEAGSANFKFVNESPVKMDISAMDMVTFFFEGFKNLNDEDLAKTKYAQRVEVKTQLFAQSFNESDIKEGVLHISDRHVHVLNEMLSDYIHMTFLSGADEMKFSTGIAGVVSLAYTMLTVAFFVLAVVNLVLGLCGRKAPYKYVVGLLCFILPAIAAYSAIIYVTMGVNAPTIGLLLAAVPAAIGVLGAAIIGLFARREHSWLGVLTRGGTLVLAAAMIAIAFMPMFTLTVRTQYSNAARMVNADAHLSANFYDSINMSCGQYEQLHDEYGTAYESLSQMKKSEFEEGEKSAMQIKILATVLVLCADQAYTTHAFSYTMYLLVAMLIFAALVIWQCLIYFTQGRDRSRLNWFFRSVAAVMMLLVLVMNIVIVAVANAGAKGSTFIDVSQRLSDYMALGLGVASICGIAFAVAMMCIPHGNYKKWVWGAYVLLPENRAPAAPAAQENAPKATPAVTPAETPAETPVKETVVTVTE